MNSTRSAPIAEKQTHLSVRASYAWVRSDPPAPLGSGYEYVLLSGSRGGPYSLLFRASKDAPSPPNTVPSLSDQPLECYVLSGGLKFHGLETVGAGDYANVAPDTELAFDVDGGTEGLLIARGRILNAPEVFRALNAGTLLGETAAELIKLPWMDYLRKLVSALDLPVVKRALGRGGSPRVLELCVSIARGIPGNELVPIVEDIFGRTEDMSLKVTALLYLASKGRIEIEAWPAHLEAFDSRLAELLAVLRAFYGVPDNQSLVRAVAARIASGIYKYNEPFYLYVVKQCSAVSSGT